MTRTPRFEPSRPPAPRPGHRSVFDVVVIGVIFLVAVTIFLHATDRLPLGPEYEQRAQQVLGLVYLAGWLTLGLALIVVVRLLRELLVLVAGLTRSASQLADRSEALTFALERIAEAIERGERRPAARPAAATEAAAAPLAGKARAAIRSSDWDEARRLIAELRQTDSGASNGEAERIDAELRGRLDQHAGELKARIEAARAAPDPSAVVEHFAALAPLLVEAERVALERQLLPWLLATLMRRMRSGTVAADVARLAEDIAAAFPATAEGASLRASLPTLRRSAGLCARCGRPYAGLEDACPECLARAVVARGPRLAEPGDENPEERLHGAPDETLEDWTGRETDGVT
jgi:hypothetical protein